MYSSVAAARSHLRSAIACLIVGCLLLLVRTDLSFLLAYSMVVPVGPLGLSLRALDRGAYRQALWCACLGAAGCVLVSAFWGITSGPGLFCLVALLFSAMAGAQLRRLC